MGDSDTRLVLIAGANGAIGDALHNLYSKDGWNVVTLSRRLPADIVVTLSEESCLSELESILDTMGSPDLIINCSGLLHSDKFMPERQLSDLNTNWLTKSLQVNLNSHINLVKAIDRVLDSKKPITWVSLSAMVGSISDNGLGGWYSYRISKASLNMFVKNLSIEWKRKNKKNRAFAIHPGTTKSEMSSPFRIKADKLYEPVLSAERIKSVIDNTCTEANGQFLNWDGQRILW